MKITDIWLLPLRGATLDGGWDQGFGEEDNLHTLVEVVTDEGITGLGSVYTSAKLCEGALGILRPLARANPPSSRRASPRSCISPPSGRAAAAPSRIASPASTSRCGTSSARSPVSRSRGCWAAATAIGSSRTDRS